MTRDDDNPYRFTGGASAPSLLPQLSIDALRKVARYRRPLVATAAIHYAGWALMIVGSDPTPWIDDDYVFGFGVTCLFALPFFGAFAIPRLSPRLGFVKALSLLVPLLNAAVVAYVLYDSRLRLESQGVRPGWFVDDFSHAAFDPPSDEARSA